MCDCIDKCNEALTVHGAELDIPAIVDLRTGLPILPHRTQLLLRKADSKKRGRLPWLAAMFCPFCGQKYADAAAAGETDEEE